MNNVRIIVREGGDMREIKFRAWHKPSLMMRMVYAIGFNSSVFSQNVSSVFLVGDDTCPADREFGSGKWTPAKDVELMQFTGLFDKSGKEIWEGDIVNVHSAFVDFSADAGKVVFNRGYFGYDEGRFANHISFERLDMRQVEVLGNIYESKPLLSQSGREE